MVRLYIDMLEVQGIAAYILIKNLKMDT